MRRVERAFRQALIRVVASDPTHQRLRLAIRGTLALGGTVGAIALLAQLLGQSVLAAAPAVIVAMIGTLAVNDASLRARLVTLAIGAVAAATGVSVGAALAGAGVVSRVVFVLAAGGAVLAQQLGPRGFVAGMLAFISYFVALFLAVPAQSLWFTAVAIGAAAAVSAIVKELLVTDHPVRDLRRTIGAFAARAAEVERAANTLGSAGDDGPDGTRRRRLRRRIVDLRETALAIQDQLDNGQRPTSQRVEDLVLDVTLAAEDLAEQAVHGQQDALRAGRADLLPLLDELRGAGRQAVPEQCTPEAEGDDADEDDDAGDDTAGEEEDEDGPRVAPVVAKAVQATVATGVAVPLGLLVSSQRWYWAALGAFVVFTRPSTAAESVVRGAERLLGTTAGAAAGIALGSAAEGSRAAQVVLLVVAMFATLYAFRLSYALAMTGITTLLAVLYDLMGRFSDQLLELRVAETAIGVTLGSLAATFILPTSTRKKVREKEDDLLEELQDFLEQVARGTQNGERDLRGRARKVEQKAQELRDVAQPLTRPLPGLGSRERRRRVILLASLGRAARQIAQAAPANDGSDASGRRQHDLDALMQRLAAARDGDTSDGDGALPRLARSEEPVAGGLQRVARVLDRLEEHSGL